MILIIGSNHDDVLYFESKMRNTNEEIVLSNIKIIKGTIFNQQVYLLCDVYSNYMTATLANMLIQKYHILLAFCVGRCVSFTDDLKNGDIVVSRYTYLGEVDQIGVKNALLGQIPNLPQYFSSDVYLLETLQRCLDHTTQLSYRMGNYVSFEKGPNSIQLIQNISRDKVMFGRDEHIVLDTESGGLALACYLNNVPFVSVKVVERKATEKDSVEKYIKALKKYPDIGKAVASCIGEIGRNEVISGK